MRLHPNRSDDVERFLAELDHPLEAAVLELRAIIKGVDSGITEQVKWNAPSFSYRDSYLCTFNLRAVQHVHLIFHNPHIAEVSSDLLEGDYPDRRMAYFADLSDVRAKRSALAQVVAELVGLNRSSSSG